MKAIIAGVLAGVAVMVIAVPGDVRVVLAQPDDGSDGTDGADGTDGTDGIDVSDGREPWSSGIARADRQRARQLFREGNRFFAIPIFPRAIERYQAAITLWPHPRFHFNLAVAQLNNGDEAGARASLDSALRHGARPLGQEGYEEAQQLLADTESRLGRILVTCAPRGVAIAIDGKHTLECAGGKDHLIWLAPGQHEVDATKGGHVPARQSIAVPAGAVVPVSFTLLTLTQASDESRRWPVWMPWSVLGSGAAIIAAGVGIHARAASNYSAYDDRFVMLPCNTDPDPMMPGCPAGDIPASLDEILRRADRQQQVAVGLYIAGGVVVGVGIALQLLNRPRSLEQLSTGRGARVVDVTPMVSSGLMGASVRIHFGRP